MIKKLLLLAICALCSLLSMAQYYSGYVGDWINIDRPKEKIGDYELLDYRTYSLSRNLDVSYLSVKILGYFEGHEAIECIARYVRTWHVPGSYTNYYDYQNVTSHYYISCNPVRLIGLPSSIVLKPKETQKITWSYSPDKGYRTVSWESDDQQVAEVSDEYSSSAVLYAKSPGKTIIRAINGSGPNEYIYVTVKADPPTHISLPATETTKVGESLTLIPTLTPNDSYTELSWKSSDEKVATVFNGIVTGKKTGTSKITATTDNGLSAECIVTVEKGVVILTADVESGVCITGTVVTLKASQEDAVIYYTLDGTTPTTQSIRYTSPITLDSSVTLKAIATGSEYETTEVLIRNYQVTSLALKDSWPEAEAQTPFFIPAVFFSKSVHKGSNIGNVSLTNVNDTVAGKVLIQDGVLFFVPDEVLPVGNYILTIPDNSVVDKDGEPNLKAELKLTIEEGLESIIHISAGFSHSLAIKTDNTLWAWGNNEKGQLGDGTTDEKRTPTKIMDGVAQVSAGWYDHSLAVKTDGSLWVWGGNNKGRLGDGTTTNRTTPVMIMESVTYVTAGGNHSLAIKTDSTLWAWGENNPGMLGDGTLDDKLSPVMVMDSVVYASAGCDHSLAIKSDSTLWIWGSNYYGQLGNDKATLWHIRPHKVMENVVYAVAGFCNTFAIKSDGSLWAWGRNGSGELGDGTTVEKHTPMKIMDGIAKVYIGTSCSFFKKIDGSVWACGWNYYGQLGDGSNNDRTKLVRVLDDIEEMDCNYHTLAIKTDGTLWAWGRNGNGQLGDGTAMSRNTPHYIMGKSSFNQVTNVYLPKNSVQLFIGSQYLLLPYYSPGNGCFKSVVFNSDNPEVATVTPRGIIEAKRKGMATVTLTVDDNFTLTFEVEVKRREMNVSVPASGYVSFFDSQSTFILPSGLTANVVTSSIGGKLYYENLTDGFIPKRTAVMLASKNQQAESFTLSQSDSDTSYTGTNLLHGSDEPTITTGDGLHYKLSYGPSGTGWSDVFGWYWGAQSGAPFQIEGHKAWLVVPKSNYTRAAGFSIEGDILGIEEIGHSQLPVDKYYDLQGRRVNQPSKKGLYIRNGKKIVK